MCVYIYIYVYVYKYICTYIYIYIYICMYVYLQHNKHTYLLLYEYLCVCVISCTYMYIYIYIYIYVCRIHNMFVSLAQTANMIACEEKMTHEMVSRRNWHRQNLTKATQTFYLTLHTIGDWRKNMLERTWTLSGLTSYLINY